MTRRTLAERIDPGIALARRNARPTLELAPRPTRAPLVRLFDDETATCLLPEPPSTGWAPPDPCRLDDPTNTARSKP